MYSNNGGASSPNWAFYGQISNVAIYNDARTAAEILEDYKSGYVDLTDPNLVAYYPMDEGTGTAIDNAQGNAALDGTAINSPSWVNVSDHPLTLEPQTKRIDMSGLTFTPSANLNLKMEHGTGK